MSPDCTLYSNTSDALPLPLAYVAFLGVPVKLRVSTAPGSTETSSLKFALTYTSVPPGYVPLAMSAVTLCTTGRMPSTIMDFPSESELLV